MLPKKVFTFQPPPGTPIDPEFQRDLVAAFNGTLRPDFHRYITKTGVLTKVGRGLTSVEANDIRNDGNVYEVDIGDTHKIFGVSSGASPDTLVELPAGSWTFQVRVQGIGLGSGGSFNPGFWRTTSTENGTTWVIQNSNTGRPWIRVNGTDILKPASGPAWITGQTLDLLVRYVDGKRIDVWWNGIQQHTATHAVTAAALTGTSGIYTIGCQNGNEFTPGSYSNIRFWSRDLTDQQMERLARNPHTFYAPQTRRFWINAVVAAGNTIAVPAGSLTLTGFAPTIVQSANNVVAVPAGSLALTGQTPTVIASNNQTVAVPLGTLTLTGFAPTVNVGGASPNTISVPLGSLSLTGFAPTIVQSANQIVSVPLGTLTLTGFAPTVTATANNVVQVPAGTLTLSPFAPVVNPVAAAVSTTVVGGGPAPKRRHFVEIKGELHRVEDEAEAIAILQQLADEATQPKVVKKAVVKAVSTAQPVVVPVLPDLPKAEEMQAKINEVYERALQQMLDDDDEDVFLLL